MPHYLLYERFLTDDINDCRHVIGVNEPVARLRLDDVVALVNHRWPDARQDESLTLPKTVFIGPAVIVNEQSENVVVRWMTEDRVLFILAH